MIHQTYSVMAKSWSAILEELVHQILGHNSSRLRCKKRTGFFSLYLLGRLGFDLIIAWYFMESCYCHFLCNGELGRGQTWRMCSCGGTIDQFSFVFVFFAVPFRQVGVWLNNCMVLYGLLLLPFSRQGWTWEGSNWCKQRKLWETAALTPSVIFFHQSLSYTLEACGFILLAVWRYVHLRNELSIHFHYPVGKANVTWYRFSENISHHVWVPRRNQETHG